MGHTSLGFLKALLSLGNLWQCWSKAPPSNLWSGERLPLLSTVWLTCPNTVIAQVCTSTDVNMKVKSLWHLLSWAVWNKNVNTFLEPIYIFWQCRLGWGNPKHRAWTYLLTGLFFQDVLWHKRDVPRGGEVHSVLTSPQMPTVSLMSFLQ